MPTMKKTTADEKKAAAWAAFVKEREALIDARNEGREAADAVYERTVAPINRQMAELKKRSSQASAKKSAANERIDKQYALGLRRAKARLEAIHPAALRWA